MNRVSPHAPRAPRAPLLLALLLLLLALLPRLLASPQVVTADEAYHWFDRVALFRTSMLRGDYAATNIIGHPGVTTMWLGSIGAQTHAMLAAAGLLPPPPVSAAHAGTAEAVARAAMRAPLALANSLALLAAWLLLRRLFAPRVALLAAMLWATDPFLVAHSQILHLDALLTSLTTLALLAALVAFRFDAPPPPTTTTDDGVQPPRWGMLLASALASGMALLTKSPAIILLPMVGTIGLAGMARGGSWFSSPRQHLAARAGWLLLAALVWSAAATLVWVALWPAAWANLPAAVERVWQQAAYDGGSPHGWGNYFLGRAVDNPGARFYPVVLLLRLPPWTLAGLLLLWVQTPRTPNPEPRTLLLLYVLLFLAMMTLPPKKFDRYLLPVFPALSVLAATGLAATAARMLPHPEQDSHRRDTTKKQRIEAGAWALLLALLAGNLAWYHPYELAYYNPLAGGGRMAAWALPVGWGEGYEQATAFVAAQPDGCERALATWFAPVVRTTFRCPPWFVPMEQAMEPGVVDYALLYIDQVQRQNTPAATAWLQQQHTPVYTVTLHDIDYVWVYQVPHPTTHRINAAFGTTLRLRGASIDSTAVRSNSMLTLTLQWEPLEPIHHDYAMFVHVFDAAGRRIGQIDVPPGGPRAPPRTWPMHSYRHWSHPLPLSTPGHSVRGPLFITLGIYDPQDMDMARLPLTTAPSSAMPRGTPDDGAHALVLPPVALPQP